MFVKFKGTFQNLFSWFAGFFVMKEKGVVSDVSAPIANSIEDAESMDRATSISTGRSWADPSVKMHVCYVNQLIHFIFSLVLL